MFVQLHELRKLLFNINICYIALPAVEISATKFQDKHWLLRQVIHPMNKDEFTLIDETHVNRLVNYKLKQTSRSCCKLDFCASI